MQLPSIGVLSKSLPPIIAIFLVSDIALCAAYLVNILLGQPFSKLTALLDLNGENSLPSWYSSMQFFFIFLLATVYVCNQFRNKIKSITLAILPAIFLMMSIDEAVQIHEWLGRRSDVLLSGGSRVGTAFEKTGIWILVLGLPFLGLFLLWARTLKRYVSDNSSLNKLVLGVCIMLSGALGCEFLSNFIGSSFLEAELIAEEGLEMIGSTVMLWAVYDLTLQYLPAIGPAPVQPAANTKRNDQFASP